MKFFKTGRDGETRELDCRCSFGIIEGVGIGLAALSSTIAAGAGAVGVGATTAGILGEVGTGALVGGALGAATDWKQPLKGAEYGAITGAGIGLGPALGAGLGIGSMGGDVLAGAASGTLGGLATGRPLGTSALEGAGSGLIAGALQPSAFPGSTPTTGGAAGAGASAAPGSVPVTGGDVTASGMPGVSGAAAPASTAGVGSQVASNIPGSVGTGAAAGATSPLSSPYTTFSSLGTGASGTTGALAPSAGVTGLTPSVPSVPPVASAGLGQQVGDFLKTPGGLLSVGGLGANLVMGNEKPQGFSQLQAQAKQQMQSGSVLESYMQTGQLPPGMQSALDTAANAARASVRQMYANAGMSGSSAEAQDIANVGNQEAAKTVEVAQNLFNAGVQQTEMGDSLYKELMDIQMQQDKDLSQAIGSFASAFAGMGTPPKPTG